MRRFDAIVIGGGLVGTAIGYGLAGAGLAVALLDEGDVAYRASRGNFGLVWVQSKGLGAPHYQRWTRASADGMAALAAELQERTGIEIGHERSGGVQLCLSEEELAKRHAMMEQMRAEAGNFGFEYSMLDHAELAAMLPGLGPAVAGASWTPYNGHVNSLALFHALHKGFAAAGGTYLPNGTVTAARRRARRFSHRGRRRDDRRAKDRARRGARQRRAGAAASGSARRCGRSAARSSSPNAPRGPGRSRSAASGRRRRAASSSAAAKRMSGSTPARSRKSCEPIARRAVLSFPWLAELQIVRAWAALRVMPPDGLPIYDQSERFPGRLHRQLPQRRHPGGGACQIVRADGRDGRARPRSGAVFRQALRCSGSGLTAGRATIAVEVEGRIVMVPPGASAAAAVLIAGLSSFRDTPVGHRERGALLHDGHLLRLPGRDRRRAQPAKLHGRRAARHAHPPPEAARA